MCLVECCRVEGESDRLTYLKRLGRSQDAQQQDFRIVQGHTQDGLCLWLHRRRHFGLIDDALLV